MALTLSPNIFQLYCAQIILHHCFTVLGVTVIRNSLGSTDFLLKKKKKSITKSDDYFKFIYSAFLLTSSGMSGCRNGDRLRSGIFRAWNSRKYKVVGPVTVLHRVLELERWVSGR